MREIGIDVKLPTGEWDGDENCPFYGSLRLRGQMFEGVVSGVGMQKTITIERNNVRYMKKYERFEKRTSTLSAHLPSCIGDIEVGAGAGLDLVAVQPGVENLRHLFEVLALVVVPGTTCSARCASLAPREEEAAVADVSLL